MLAHLVSGINDSAGLDQSNHALPAPVQGSEVERCAVTLRGREKWSQRLLQAPESLLQRRTAQTDFKARCD